jgi:hypothetical protein
VIYRVRIGHSGGVRVQFLAEESFFFLLQPPKWLWVLFSLLSNGYWAVLSLALTWPGHEADHSPPSSAFVKNDGAILPLPHVPSQHSVLLIKHSDDSTFFIIVDSCLHFILVGSLVIHYCIYYFIVTVFC